MNSPATDLLERFETLKIAPADFSHSDHLQVAYAMLEKYEFVDACTRYAATIKAMAESVGALDKYNATITIAFMSVIAERKASSDEANLQAFLTSNPDLQDRNILMSWYSKERLTSDLARKQFLLPDNFHGGIHV